MPRRSYTGGMGSQILSRRRLIRGGLSLAGLGLAAGCVALAPLLQPRSKVYRVAWFTGSTSNPATQSQMAAFRQTLHDLGYVEGQNLTVDELYAGSNERLAEPAAELVRQQPDVVLVPSPAVAMALQVESKTIPIVLVGLANIGAGTILSHPGENVTGLSTPFLGGKHLQILKEAVPTLARVAFLRDPAGATRQPHADAARALGLDLRFVDVGTLDEVRAAFAAGVGARGDGLLVGTGPALGANLALIAQLALQHGLPSIWQQNEAASQGGLLAYGPNRLDLFRRAAAYVDKILKGAKPGDLPFEQPTVFDFVVNLKTAEALGLTMPPSLLAQSTAIIQ